MKYKTYSDIIYVVYQAAVRDRENDKLLFRDHRILIIIEILTIHILTIISTVVVILLFAADKPPHTTWAGLQLDQTHKIEVA